MNETTSPWALTTVSMAALGLGVDVGVRLLFEDLQSAPPDRCRPRALWRFFVGWQTVSQKRISASG